MRDYYRKSVLVLCIFAVIVSLIMFHNEDISFITWGTAAITTVVALVSIILMPISKKIINIGDKKKHSKLYYSAVIPGGIILAALGTVACMWFFNTCVELDLDLGGAILLVFFFEVVFITLLVPFLQVLIVLVLRARDNKRKNCE